MKLNVCVCERGGGEGAQDSVSSIGAEVETLAIEFDQPAYEQFF